MMKATQTLALIAAAIWSTAALAHDGMGPHGGRLADTGTHHLELVVTKDKIDVFVSTKASAPIAANDLTGLAIIVANGASTRIALAASGEKLTGQASAPLADDAKTIVRVKLADGQTIQASFDEAASAR
ncbi:MAG: hypothetical protein JWR29_2083 [Tardiphaga sp.]|nr:hypothetical protein [Tardiphaga sp.]